LIHLFQKNVNDELDAIEKLIAKGERDFIKAFREYLKTLKSAAMIRAVRQFLENNDIEGLIAHINKAQKPFGKVLAELMIAAGTAEVAALKPKIQRKLNRIKPPGTPNPTVGIDFQVSNPRAASILQEQTSRLIREINESQRLTIFQVLAATQTEGKTPRQAAQTIVDSIGLTSRQEQAVSNYERLLRAGNKEALDRDLRDRRFDRAVRRMEEKPLTADQIGRMVSRYREKYERYRASVIARTESHTAVNAARQEALLQSVEQSGIDPATVKREWRATRDKRTRDSHNEETGTKVGLQEPFVINGARLLHPGDRSLGAPAKETINCRCVTVTRFEG